MKNKTPLTCIKIEFTKFSIKYFFNKSILDKGNFSWCCPPDVVDKDLIPKNNIISRNSNFVVYTPSNVTPEFYQSIFDETIRNVSEYEIERNHIYNIGDVVGFI